MHAHTHIELQLHIAHTQQNILCICSALIGGLIYTRVHARAHTYRAKNPYCSHPTKHFMYMVSSNW